MKHKADAATARHHTGLRAKETYIRRELRRHFLSERERLVADALLEISFGWGLFEVAIPRLDDLGLLVGLPRPHVFTALVGLQNMKIVRIRQVEGLNHYEFNDNTDSWKVKIRVARAVIQHARELLMEVNHLSPSAEPLLELSRTLTKPIPEKSLGELANGNAPAAELLNDWVVTESVTVTPRKLR